MKTHTLQIYNTFQKVNRKVADQTGRMHRLICACSEFRISRVDYFQASGPFSLDGALVRKKNGGLSHMRACSVTRRGYKSRCLVLLGVV